MTSRLKIITDMKELTTVNDYKTNETNETYIIKLKRDIDKLIHLYENGDDKINTIERIKQFLKKNN
jgi:hypothetical protein